MLNLHITALGTVWLLLKEVCLKLTREEKGGHRGISRVIQRPPCWMMTNHNGDWWEGFMWQNYGCRKYRPIFRSEETQASTWNVILGFSISLTCTQFILAHSLIWGKRKHWCEEIIFFPSLKAFAMQTAIFHLHSPHLFRICLILEVIRSHYPLTFTHRQEKLSSGTH